MTNIKNTFKLFYTLTKMTLFTGYSGVHQHFLPTLREQRQTDLYRLQASLVESESQAIQGYIGRPFSKDKSKEQRKKD